MTEVSKEVDSDRGCELLVLCFVFVCVKKKERDHPLAILLFMTELVSKYT
jgi:hypothetical protein